MVYAIYVINVIHVIYMIYMIYMIYIIPTNREPLYGLVLASDCIAARESGGSGEEKRGRDLF